MALYLCNGALAREHRCVIAKIYRDTAFPNEVEGHPSAPTVVGHSIVIPLQLQHDFVHGRSQLAEIPLRTEPQAEVT